MTSAIGSARDDDAPLLLNKIVAAHAAGLARRGKYHAAEELIQPVIASGAASPQLLDLMARIRVQQGRVDEAAALWREALSKDAGNAGFRAALDCVSRNQHPAAKRVAWGMGLVFGAALLLTSIGIAFRPHARQTILSNPPALRPIGKPILLNPAPFRSPYTTSDVQAESVKIAFTQPVFAHDVRLTAYGRLALADLAERLHAFAPGVELTIIGKTDGVPARKAGRYSDNSVLGMLRALAAYNQLRRHIPDLTVPKLAAESSGAPETGTPEPKQRTVEIVLTVPAKAGR
jgi:hypothetical protein